jgi:hypothetical protein
MASEAKVEFAWNSPVSKPLARGTRARMPTCFSLARVKNRSAGRCRKQLQIICTVCTFGNSIALSAFQLSPNRPGFRRPRGDSTILLEGSGAAASELRRLKDFAGCLQPMQSDSSGCILQRFGEANAGPLLWQLRSLPYDPSGGWRPGARFDHHHKRPRCR